MKSDCHTISLFITSLLLIIQIRVRSCHIWNVGFEARQRHVEWYGISFEEEEDRYCCRGYYDDINESVSHRFHNTARYHQVVAS